MIVQDYLDDLSMLVENSGTSPYNPVYIGWAAPGSATSASQWKIQKLTYDANNKLITKKWADKSARFNKVWDDRASYTYG